MKLFLDECLSPGYVRDLAGRGYPDTVHPINIGLRSARDDQIVDLAFADDRIIVTANARDFKRLLAKMPIHPGAIIVEPLKRDATFQQIMLALAFIELQLRPADYMVNRVIEVSAGGGVQPYVLSSDDV